MLSPWDPDGSGERTILGASNETKDRSAEQLFFDFRE